MNESIAGRKADLRGEALARRDALPADEREAASRRIVERLTELLDKRAVRSVAATSPILSEADVLPLLAAAAERGLDTALPNMAEGVLSFRRWRPGDSLTSGAFGVPEPPADALEITPQLIVLPLVAFDANGNRLGYGKGHFDRALAALIAAGARPLLAGAGFAVQEVPAIPVEPHDVALDLVVTESGIVTPARSEG